MKKIIFLSCWLVILQFMLHSCNDGNRIDQVVGLPTPQQVTITEVKSIPGGAVIKVKIPDDQYLKGVMASYVRNGSVVNTRISRYLDSLVIEGYADTEQHEVKITSFNAEDKESKAQSVNITPLVPDIQTVDFSMRETFGGIKIHVKNNVNRADMAVVILADKDMNDLNLPDDQKKWVEITTLFTATKDIELSRRGLSPEQTIFGVYLRDHWGNRSPLKTIVLTPLEEKTLDKGKFRYKNPGDDNVVTTNNSQYYPIDRLWDGSGSSAFSGNKYWFFASDDGPLPSWLTIDLGVKARLSRIAVLPRQAYFPYQQGSIREIEFWGSLNPTGALVPANTDKHGFDDTWVCLGKFQQPKPSGYLPNGSVGVVPSEDWTYYNEKTEYEMDNSGAYPHAWDQIRYLRIVCVSTFATWDIGLTHGGWQLGEITPYGQISN